MAQDTKKKSSTRALLAAFAVLLITILGLGWNLFLSAALAAATFFVVVQLSEKKDVEDDKPLSRATAHRVARAEPEAQEIVPEEPVSAAQSEAGPVQTKSTTMAGQVKLGTLLPGERELADRRGGWRYEG